MKLKSKPIPGGVQDHLPHSLVEEKTLKDSLTKLLGTTKSLPDISEGYKVWKEVFDTGQGGDLVSEKIQVVSQRILK